MASPKSSEDDDVILYMDQLSGGRSNGLLRSASSGKLTASSADLTEKEPAATASIASHAQAGPHLLETDNVNNRHQPAHPLQDDYHHRPHSGERDVEEFEPETHHRAHHHEHYPGIDDGLLPDPDDEPASLRPSSPRPHPQGGTMPTFPNTLVSGGSPPDMNVYQQKKTIAQGMMDLALISANANQFRYVLQSSGRHPYYYPSLAMIGLSLFLQVVVGIGLIWNSRYNVKVEAQMCKANRANNWTVIAIFLVTILNVFISSFVVVESSDAMFPPNAAASSTGT